MTVPGQEPPEAEKARSKRNLMLALALAAFVVLMFVITILKLSGNAAAG